jgi:hypothetical protein
MAREKEKPQLYMLVKEDEQGSLWYLHILAR